jgi:hypothetical protein
MKLKNIIFGIALYSSLLFAENQTNFSFSTNKKILPDLKVSYSETGSTANLNMSLDDMVNVTCSHDEITTSNYGAFEEYNDKKIHYLINSDDNSTKVTYLTSTGIATINSDTISYSVTSLISNVLNKNIGEGNHSIFADEKFYDIKINKLTETDSTITYGVPGGMGKLPIKDIKIKLEKNKNILFPLEIKIEFPWYLPLSDYILKKEE